MNHDNPDAASNRPEVLRVFQSRDETKAFYNKISQVYDLLADRSEEPVRQAGLEKLNARSGETVLEIGFGTGHSLVALAQATGSSGKVYGIDLSDGMLEIARERLENEGLAEWAELTCGDATRLPYPDETMDAIFMSYTLELFDTPEIPKVLAECLRVLRPGGRIVGVGMSKEGEDGVILHLYEWTHKHFPNFVDCRPIFVRNSMEASGFIIQSVEKMTIWVPVEIVLALKDGRKSGAARRE
jgi:demethylmenaquinone methyltransferase/2-methoxy-6-polyprenyl-1,4-benzoquinol methylase